MGPTPEQIEAYRRDGFLVIEEWLGADEVERVRERFHRCFEHEWETGLAPDEVNSDPATTPPDRTRQLCNVWKAVRTLAADDPGFPLAKVATLDDALDALADFGAGRTPETC